MKYSIYICDFSNLIKMQLYTDRCNKKEVIKLLLKNGFIVAKKRDANHYISTSEISSDVSVLNLWLTKI